MNLRLKLLCLLGTCGYLHSHLGANSSGTALHHQPLYMGLSCFFYFNKKS